MTESEQFLTGTPAVGRGGAAGGLAGSPAGQAEFTAGVLQAALSRHGIECIVALAWTGPQIDAYTVSLGLNATPERVEGLAGALALAAGAESCRVARIPGKLLLEIPKPKEARRPLLATRLDRLNPTSPTAVAAGITTGGQVVWVDIADERHAHAVIGGVTGSGKSVLLHWLLYRLALQNPERSLRMILLDPKRFELQRFAGLPHLLHPITSTPLESGRILSWVEAELERRAETGRKRPRILVVIEEVADVTAKSRTAGPLMNRIAQIGRALGISLLVSTQQPGAKSLGDALVNFPLRILGRVSSGTLTYGAAGRARTAADMLLGRGDMLMLCAGETVRFQAPLPDEALFVRLPRAEQAATLDEELPSVVSLADLERDPRGGQGRRPGLDYDAIAEALEDGAGIGELRSRFGIGYARAERLKRAFNEEN